MMAFEGVRQGSRRRNAVMRGAGRAAGAVRRTSIGRRFRRGFRRTDPVLLGLDAVVMLAAAVVASWGHDLGSLLWAAAVVLVALLGMELSGLHRPRFVLSALDDLPRLAGWVVTGAGVAVVVARADPRMDRVLGFAAVVLVVMFVVRAVYFATVRSARRRSSDNRMRAVVVGDGVITAELIACTRAQPELGVDVVVAVSADPMDVVVDSGVPIASCVADLPKIIRREGADAVFVSFQRLPDGHLLAPLRACSAADCEIFIVPRLFESAALTHGMDRIHTVPLVRMKRDALRAWHWRSKRAFDLVVVSTALVLLAPVLAALAVGVFLTDPKAPILFRQRRIARDGREFDLLKFRSMKPVPEVSSDSEWKPADEERIGRFGRYIRRRSLDELPQLWNVIRGDMSVVGPRPERPHFVEQFSDQFPGYRHRHRVDVGLTGWAAVHGLRGDTSISDRARFDNFYIENWSPWLDTKIMILTIGAVLRGTGD